MIPQEFNLVPTLSVFENIFIWGRRLRGKDRCLNKKEMRNQDAGRCLEELGNTDLSP